MRWLNWIATRKYVAERYESDMAQVLARLEHIAQRQTALARMVEEVRLNQVRAAPKWRHRG